MFVYHHNNWTNSVVGCKIQKTCWLILKKDLFILIMPTEKPILTFAVDEKLLERINDFRFDNRIETKSEAIRKLVEKGLKEYEKKTKK